MTSNDGAGQDGATRALLRDLHGLAAPGARDDTFHQELRARLLLQATQQIQHYHEGTPPMATRPNRSGAGAPRRSRLRTRVACAAAALLLALGGAAGYLRLNAPTPAAAETMRILRHAITALRLDPNGAAHVTYAITVTLPGGYASAAGTAAGGDKATGGLTGTADVWVQAGANGAPARSAQTLSMDKTGMDVSRYILVGRQVYAYNPEMRGDNSILIGPEGRGSASWLVPTEVFEGAGATQELATLAQQSPQRVRLLGQQSLDGHTVDAIEVDGWTDRPAQRTTFYFDAQSYLLRGFDADSLDPSYPTPAWQARLVSYTTMPAGVPPHTFTLNAPATAWVQPIDPPDIASFGPAFAAVCHGSLGTNPKTLLRPSQSLLDVCRATAPNVTAAELAAALAAPQKAPLDAAAAEGQITPAQAAAGLAMAQAQLTTLVSTPAGK